MRRRLSPINIAAYHQAEELEMLSYENNVTFVRHQESRLTLRSFWAPEDGFVWSRGKWCEIVFTFEAGGRTPVRADLMLDLDVYKRADVLTGQNVLIYLNGLRVGSRFVSKRQNVISEFDPKILKSDGNVLTIDTPNSASPVDFGEGDTRVLGVQLFSLQIRKSD